MLFLVGVGVAAAVTVPTVGTLLIFSLMVGPAAAAAYISPRPGMAIVIGVSLSVIAIWIAMIAAYDTGWPVGFLVAFLVSIMYFAARIIAPARSSKQGKVAVVMDTTS
jgi:zinc/manganese transport system permease protein